ncbi:MAG: methylated-DNA--[protein]-cysteine S-methyltransferase [Chloroflexi bacterium]|nr:methylated-DNA--[protein]-cysteine S-methyltransferase [Chloroflexota bacterium]
MMAGHTMGTRDDPQVELTRTLETMRRREKIPASRRRAEIREKLLGEFVQINLSVVETSIGWIGLAWSARGLVSLVLPRKSQADAKRDLRRDFPKGIEAANAPAQMVQELTQYASGQQRTFDVPLDWSSIKPFQRAVLQVTSTIPFGQTRSYAWVAHQIGRPRASRAVGRALATNPIPIILPCHRVIGSDGGLHGYGGGLPMKAMLLKLEGAMLQ